MTDKQTTDVRRCVDCGTEWESPMGSPFVCPRCGFTSTLLGTHPLSQTTLDLQVARENMAWWDNLRQEHLRKGQLIAAGKCQEEIELWQEEINNGQ